MMPSGARKHRLTLAQRGTPQPDRLGGYTDTPTPLDPAVVHASIEPATQRTLERLMANVSISVATHVLTMPYHSGVTTQTVAMFGTRTFHVQEVHTPHEDRRETIAICQEIVT